MKLERELRIGIVSTRLAGVDGVTFEVAKWEATLTRMGHEVRLCAGELDALRPNTRLIPALHFNHPPANQVSQAAFRPGEHARSLRREVNRQAAQLVPALSDWIDSNRLDNVIVQNAWAVPMQLPLAVALRQVVERTGIPAISHNHDYWWERDRFSTPLLPDVLEYAFPPDLPNVRHVSINSLAAQQLYLRRGISSTVIPNVFDFDRPRPQRGPLARRRLRRRLGLPDDALVVVQPTRVVPRKGIELAIELVSRLGRPNAILLITGPAGDEGHGYLAALEAQARRGRVELRYAPDLFAPAEDGRASGPADSLHDAYLGADLITYPSLYEGWGNALVEAVFYGVPVLVNRYPVYEADIRPLGLRLIEIDGRLTSEAVEEVRELLANPRRRLADARHNFEVGRQHLSYASLAAQLDELIRAMPVRRVPRAA